MIAYRITSTEYSRNEPQTFLFIEGRYYGNLTCPRQRKYPTDIDYWRYATCADSDRYFHVEQVSINFCLEAKLITLHRYIEAYKHQLLEYSYSDYSYNVEADNYNRAFEAAITMTLEKISAIIAELPKSWVKLMPPCKFKDGNIMYVKSYSKNEFIIIFKEIKNDHIHKYVCFAYQHLYIDKCALCHLVDAEIIRLATEEEKQKLFQAIKDNGHKWNKKTKTLEKLEEEKPK